MPHLGTGIDSFLLYYLCGVQVVQKCALFGNGPFLPSLFLLDVSVVFWELESFSFSAMFLRTEPWPSIGAHTSKQ